MPRGVYPRQRLARSATAEVIRPVWVESDSQIESRIAERFDILESLTRASTTGDVRAMIVSGPAGLGKSFTVEHVLGQWDPNGINHTFVKGYVRATGLYKLLYQYREQGQVIVFDDADTIFFDETSLNMLKAVCDTNETRRVSYLTEGALIDEESAERIPKTFEFHGTIIFITNYDFDAMIDKGHKLAPHLTAMISRAHYIDLTMKTRRDYLARIRQVCRRGLLDHLTYDQRQDVSAFIEANSDDLRELSLRMVLKVASLRRTSANWMQMARVTCCRNK